MLKKVLMTSAAIVVLAAAPALSQQKSPNSQPSSPQASEQQKSEQQQKAAGSSGQTGATQPSASSSQQPSGPASASTANQPANNAANPSQPGVRTVTDASLRLDFYAVTATDIRASDLIGMDVYNLENEAVGEVEDLVLDNGKNIKGIVISVGGFLGLGERNVAVQPGSVLIRRQGDAERAVINTTKETLKNAPEFKFEARNRSGSQTTGASQSENSNPAPAPKPANK
jgi:sporulation protein YlmC with PRC-barrel domain